MFSKEMTHYSYFPFCNKHSFNENTYDYQKVDIFIRYDLLSKEINQKHLFYCKCIVQSTVQEKL